MSRWIEPRRSGLVSADERGRASEAAERIVKYIPAEVLVTYTALITGLGALGITSERQYLAALLIAVFLIATVVVVWTGAPAADRVRQAHLWVSPLAFLAWSYSISACVLGTWFLPTVAFVLIVAAVGLSIMLVPKAN